MVNRLIQLITLLILTLFVESAFSGNNTDIFESYAKKMLKAKGYTISVEYIKKELFSTDTSHQFAQVTFLKTGNKISFLRIVESSSQTELLLLHDTAWAIDCKAKTVVNLGGRSAVKQDGLFQFFPFGSLLYDTAMFHETPFWNFTKGKVSEIITQINVGSLPSDITNFRYELSIDSVDLLIYKIIQESTFGEVGHMYQEIDLNNYHELTDIEGVAPSYFNTFTISRTMTEELSSNVSVDKIYTIKLDSLFLTDLKGAAFSLPSKGLLFFDLWYVGCNPCMKSTPFVEKIYEAYKDKIHFYSINEMDKDLKQIKRFKEKMGVTMPVLLTKKKEIAQQLSGGSYPLFVLIDAVSGKVLWSISGYSADLESKINDE